MSRPYLNSSIEHLEELFESSRNHPPTLQLLAEELAFRKTLRARALASKVDVAVAHARPAPALGVRTKPIAAPVVPQAAQRHTTPPHGAHAPVAQDVAAAAMVATYNHSLPESTASDEKQSVDYENNPVDLLDAWTALEVLSPRTYRRDADLASGIPGNIVPISSGRLPWDNGSATSRPNFKVFFHVVLGTIAAGPVYEALVARFKDTREERPAVAGNIVLASILVDKNGVPAGDDPVTLSAFAWGFPIALRGSLNELAAWPRKELQLVDGLTKQLPRNDADNSPTPLSMDDLVGAFDWMVATLGLPREQVVGPSFAVRAYLHFTSRIVPDPLLTNSFFLRDLAKVREKAQTNTLPATLAAYLGKLKPSERKDLLSDPSALEASLAPSLAPLGRWPTPAHHTPALLQQAAVNLASRLNSQNGVLGVNGPPGTGKSTLLRDVVADVVTRRAAAMCTFDDPTKAFNVGWTKRAQGQTQEMYALDPTLRGFEMIVASSNNKAVENVSAELPALSALPEGSDLRYFAPLAKELLERESWGMVAAVLGNRTNLSRFRKTFWTESTLSFQRYLDRAAGLTPPDATAGLADQCDAPSGAVEALSRSKVVQKRFSHLSAAAQLRLDELELLRRALLALPARQAEEAEARINFDQAAGLAENDRLELDRHSDAAHQALGASDIATRALAAHDAKRPNWLKRLVRTQDALAWREARQPLHDSEQASRRHEQSMLAAQAQASHTSDVSTRLAQEKELQLRKAKEALGLVEQRCLQISVGPGACVVDNAFHALPHAAKQLSLPWLDAEVQQTRANLFAEAMHVHKTFIDSAALPLRRNLKGLMDSFFGGIPKDRRHLAGDLWSSLFLVIPVVSTTFASVERIFERLPQEAFGWLLVDEAGQASPQEAVGALMRCQRAVVVGDPLQIEPVVSLPETLTKAVMREFNVDADRFAAPAASVQTLTDDASDHGASFVKVDGSRSVGAPLLVHRRCSSPMFDVSNAIAYGGLMVQAKQPRDSAIQTLLGPSRWIDVQGTAREKYCPEEGEEVLALLRELKRAGLKPDLYLITPFVAVQDALRQLVSTDGVLSGWVENPTAWTKERIGTVHTVQGREAEAVILVLGAPAASQNGARQWAGRLPNLLNVAVTRAKEAVYVIGNRGLWTGAGHFSTLGRHLG